jgi:hypothetical protein
MKWFATRWTCVSSRLHSLTLVGVLLVLKKRHDFLFLGTFLKASDYELNLPITINLHIH